MIVWTWLTPLGETERNPKPKGNKAELVLPSQSDGHEEHTLKEEPAAVWDEEHGRCHTDRRGENSRLF